MRARFTLLLGVLLGLSVTAPSTTADAGAELASNHWYRAGSEAVDEAARRQPNAGVGQARNVILFVGDGMSIATVTAARILAGQRAGGTGEENLLAFERLPWLALSKTYNTNQQVPDSAGTMTAMMSGVKTKARVIGVDESIAVGDFRSVAGASVPTLLEQAEARGLATGIVTTARITDATPAACYGHSALRDWENDAALPPEAREAGFADMARQLVEFSHGDGIEVALGGGRANFLPREVEDPEDAGKLGKRSDRRDLTAEWTQRRPRSVYVWTRAEFESVDPAKTDHLLGLFDRTTMEYAVDRPADPGGEPSLPEMTAKALDILMRHEKGFFLMVEGGRIDHGHHAGNAYRALDETIEFAQAVAVALERVDLSDTLVVVTADHSHTMTFAGYPTRGNDVLGLVVNNDLAGVANEAPGLDALGRTYTTLGYANGPGYAGATGRQIEGAKRYPSFAQEQKGITKGRPDLSKVDTRDPSYLQEATVPLVSETHGGEDVAIYADGPGAALFHGVREQSYIYHVMTAALGWREVAPTKPDATD